MKHLYCALKNIDIQIYADKFYFIIISIFAEAGNHVIHIDR